MSIWYSTTYVGWDDEESLPCGGEVRSYADGWSNHYPTTSGDVEPPASVNLATLAPWSVPGHGDCGEHHDAPEVGPWLLLSVDSPLARSWWGKPRDEPRYADVVMDEGAVRQLRDDLTAWLDAPKVRPKELGR